MNRIIPQLLAVGIMVSLCHGQHGAKSIALEKVLDVGTDHAFIRVEEVATDSKNDLFVTDSYRYSIKKFSSNGSLLMEYGKRGSSRGEFKSFPYKIICMNDTLALAEVGSSIVHFFTPEFMPIGEISLGGPIVDMVFNRKGRLYACMIPVSHRNEDVALVYDKSGSALMKVPLDRVRGEPAFDMIHLAVDAHDNLVVAYRYLNNVTIYDSMFRVSASFKVAGLPDESPSEKSQYTDLGAFPEGTIIQDVAIDRSGNIFVLGGDYAKNPNRDVAVYDYRGSLLTTFTLPDKTGIAFIDAKGFLYTRENKRTVVRKYRLRYTNF